MALGAPRYKAPVALPAPPSTDTRSTLSQSFATSRMRHVWPATLRCSVGFVCGDLACDAEFLHDREPVVRRNDPFMFGMYMAGGDQKSCRLLSRHPILGEVRLD